MVIGISWRILGNAADVEDNVQDVFLEACRIHERTAVRNWRGLLRRLATFGALAKRRQRRHHTSLAEFSPLDRKTPTPEETAMRREEEAKPSRRGRRTSRARRGRFCITLLREPGSDRDCPLFGHKLLRGRGRLVPGAGQVNAYFR